MAKKIPLVKQFATLIRIHLDEFLKTHIHPSDDLPEPFKGVVYRHKCLRCHCNDLISEHADSNEEKLAQYFNVTCIKCDRTWQEEFHFFKNSDHNDDTLKTNPDTSAEICPKEIEWRRVVDCVEYVKTHLSLQPERHLNVDINKHTRESNYVLHNSSVKYKQANVEFDKHRNLNISAYGSKHVGEVWSVKVFDSVRVMATEDYLVIIQTIKKDTIYTLEIRIV